MTFLLIGLACSLVVFCYVQKEISSSQQQRTTQAILSNLTYINDLEYLVNSHDGFVYIFTENSGYPTLFDRSFNFSTKGLIFFRVVEYCQLPKSKQNKSNSNKLNFSKNIWVDHLDNYTVNKSIRSLIMAYHALSSQFLEGKYPNEIFQPTQLELNHFRKSEFGKHFSYIGRGWFYHFVNQKNNKKKSFEYNFDKLFNKCTIGDIRMRLAVYAPPNISVFGWKKDSKLIVRYDIKGRKYGAFLEGKHSAKDLLDYSNGIYASGTGITKIKSIIYNNNLSFDLRLRFLLKEFFPYRAIAFLATFSVIVFYSSSPIYFVINLLFLLDVNIYFRGVIWPNKYLSSDSFWATLGIIQVGTLLYIFYHERTSEIAFISIYSMVVFIILFQFKDIFHSSEYPFIFMNNNIKIFSNSSTSV